MSQALLRSRMLGSLYGMAVCDALGGPYEFSRRGSYTPTPEMTESHTFYYQGRPLPPGSWTDDTSMALALAVSLTEKNGLVWSDAAQRWVRWFNEGYMSVVDECFDIGLTTRSALTSIIEVMGSSTSPIPSPPNLNQSPNQAGNGSIMRLAPIPVFYASSPAEELFEVARTSSYITHQTTSCLDACVLMSAMIVGFLRAPESWSVQQKKEVIMNKDFDLNDTTEWTAATPAPSPSKEIIGAVDDDTPPPESRIPLTSQAIRHIHLYETYKSKTTDEIRTSGYVVHTFEAALWALWRAETFEEGALSLLPLGEDVDTVCCVYGQLAALQRKEEILDVVFRDLVDASLKNAEKPAISTHDLAKQEEQEKREEVEEVEPSGTTQKEGLSKSQKARMKKKAKAKALAAANAPPPPPPAEQTDPPRVGLTKIFTDGIFPEGEICEYKNDNSYRTTSAEKKELERIDNEDPEDTYQNIRRAAEVHRVVRAHARKTIQPGMTMMSIVNDIEDGVRALVEEDTSGKLLSGIGFPTGLSLNNCAAHYTPNTGDTNVLQPGDTLKVDIGVHVRGRICDSAFTLNFDPSYDNLVAAVKDATNTGVREAGIDVRLGDIGAAIQEVMESYEVVVPPSGNRVETKTYPVKSIANLTGHSINKYSIHGKKAVPIVKTHDQEKMEEGEYFAIETFGSTGRGRVIESGECSHYALNPAVRNPPLKLLSAKSLLQSIQKNFGTLPWCRRYLERAGETRYLLALNSLVNSGVVQDYPPLCDIRGSRTAQFEHTILLRPT
ncbi:Methionine aminopeptidase 2, partial [Tulasnella sp. 403]